MRAGRHRSPGSVALVALCCVAVMGIGLAGYLAVSNQAMILSNRANQTGVSQQLADMGMEQALAAFNSNDWSSWTVLHNTAAKTISFDGNRYGSTGITTTIKIRVDNYNAFFLPAVWSATTSYRAGNYVLSGGDWYYCVQDHTNQPPAPPTTPYWSLASGSANAKWSSGAYNLNDIVHHAGVWYRCILAHADQKPPNSTYWSPAPQHSLTWTPGAYNLNDIVWDRGTWYRCILTHATSQPPPNSTYWASAAATDWVSTTAYNKYDNVSLNGVTYCCVLANTNQTPPNTTYWTLRWNPARIYAVGDFVSYGGVWYQCIIGHTNENPTNATYWATAAPVIYAQGQVVLPDSGSTVLTTQQRAVVAAAPLFPNAIAATSTVTFASGGTVDSYDSSRGSGTPTYNSTANPYTAAVPNRGSSAIIAGGNTLGTAVMLPGSVRLNGYATAPPSDTSPYAPRIYYGNTTIVTGVPTTTIPNPIPDPKVDNARVTRSPFIPQFDILTPNTGTSELLPASGGPLGTPYDTTWHTYTCGAQNITSNVVYTVQGPVRIVVTGDYRQNSSGGAARIDVNPPPGNAKLEMFISGDVALYGQGIQNLSKIPRNVVIYATTATATTGLNTTIPFYGVIYLPNGAFTIQNLATSTPAFYGAISAKNFTYAATNPSLHYDTTLRYTQFSGTDSPYQLVEWRELTDPAERITF